MVLRWHLSHNTVCSSRPSLPIEWSKVQIAWLPKPNKSPTAPANLRTIGLMGGDTKACLQILKFHADPYVQQALGSVPQYAYRAQASTADPLLRASLRCNDLRNLLAACNDDLTARLAGQQCAPVVGGMMASLDLSKAFDSITHSEMYESFLATGMPTSLAGFLLQIHMQTELHIVHKGYKHVISMGKGLRQGCSIAPMIYAAWTCRRCQQLEQRLGTGWPSKHLSMYADDKHGFWTIRSINDLSEAPRQLGLLINTITELGMKVNGAKSKVVLALKGRIHMKLLKRCTKYWRGQNCLIVNSPAGTMYISIQTSLEYFGVKLSYGRFEVQAAQHRVQQAHAVFNQLKAPLRVNGPLSRKHRLRLYKACVMPSLLYGLATVGCTVETIKLLSSTISRHLRKALRIYERGINPFSNRRALISGMILVGVLKHSKPPYNWIQAAPHNCGYVKAIGPSTYFSNFAEWWKWVSHELVHRS